ncbi:hypothetical protein ACWDF9_34180 [Streptomyces rubiginosohelvolus]
MPPILTFLITLALGSLPLLYLLSVIRPTLRSFALPKKFSPRQHLTTGALFLPGIGFTVLIDQYLMAGIQIPTAAMILILGAVVHRAARPQTANDATAADPHTK